MTTAAPSRSLLSRVARCVAELVATPLVPADYVDLVDPLRSGTDLRARIVVDHAGDRRRRHPRAPARSRLGRPHPRPVRPDRRRRRRRPAVARLLAHLRRPARGFTITVKAIPDGVVSNHLVRRTTPGTVVQLDQATGDFVLPPRCPRKVLFVTAGSGITPVMGMLRSIADLEDVVLVHSAPTADDVIFGAELRALAADGRIRLVELHTDADGMLTTAELAGAGPRPRRARDLGLRPDRDARHARGLLAGRSCAPSGSGPPSLVTGEGGTVTFTRTGTTVEADGATPLLDAGEAAGVLMPSGCRMGICFGCVLPLREGAVRDLRTGDITTAAVGDGVLIQTCISAAAGACDIDV